MRLNGGLMTTPCAIAERRTILNVLNELSASAPIGSKGTLYACLLYTSWVPVVDNNARSAMMRTGEAHFTFPVPYEQAAVLEKDEHLKLVAAPSIVTRYLNMNMLQKPFDDLRVRQAINYAINKEALAKVAFSGYAFPSEGPLPQGVDYACLLYTSVRLRDQ